MDAKPPTNPEIINNARNLAISRRGGIITRGGRLPPINVRELTTSNKKMVAPNIPQRRKAIKTEAGGSEQLRVKSERPTLFENKRGTGRGRQQRVYLQTEGTFLADGPAARVKQESAYGGSTSIPRAYRKSAKGSCEKNIDVDVIKHLMESFVVDEEYENENEGKPPIRLPFLKDKMTNKIKQESDSKTNIKVEIIEDFETGVKKEVKIEKEKDLYTVKESIKEEIKTKKLSANGFLNTKDEEAIILLQLPFLSTPLKVEDKEKETKEKQPTTDNEQKTAAKFMDNFEEGFMGKLKIMKSGRMKLTLGSVEFELLDGTPSETYQEAVSIQIRDKEGDVAVLGKIENKVILSPVVSKLMPINHNNNKTLDL